MKKRRALRVSYVADDLQHDLVLSLLANAMKRVANGVVATENTVGHSFGEVIPGGKAEHVQRAEGKSTRHEGRRDR